MLTWTHNDTALRFIVLLCVFVLFPNCNPTCSQFIRTVSLDFCFYSVTDATGKVVCKYNTCDILYLSESKTTDFLKKYPQKGQVHKKSLLTRVNVIRFFQPCKLPMHRHSYCTFYSTTFIWKLLVTLQIKYFAWKHRKAYKIWRFVMNQTAVPSFTVWY